MFETQYMEIVNAIFYIVILIMSVVVHEVAHGLAADSQGDPTARFAGRLSLNPLKHIDPIGSIILPFTLFFTTGFIIGWAKPVPYDERNLRDKKWGTAFVAAAGIFANLALVLIFGLAIRFFPISGAFVTIASAIVIINLLLALFNLIPIPPLDGSKILFSLYGARRSVWQSRAEQFSLPLLLMFIIFVWPMIAPVIGYVFSFITGIPLSL